MLQMPWMPIVALLAQDPAADATATAQPATEGVEAPATVEAPETPEAPPPEGTPAASAVKPTLAEPSATPPAASDPTPPTLESAPPPEPDAPPERPRFPRLVVAGGPLIGPHAIGNQECRDSDQRCVTAGGFFGAGMQAELRVRIWRPLGAHVRGLLVGNATPKDRDPIYRGLWGMGVGLGAYGRRIFARAEYLFVDTFGKETFTPPFHTAVTGSDVWGHHAGLLSVGFRQPFGERFAAELWGGPMIGPKSRRQITPSPPENRILPTFLLGLSLTYDLVR
jgi:hypothetical protein